MLEINPYRSELNGILNNIAVTSDQILLFVRCDLCTDLTRGDSFLLMTKDQLIVIEGQFMISGQAKRSTRRDRLTSSFALKETKVYELSKLSDLKIEELISTARVTVKYDEKEILLSMLTNASKGNVRLFVKYAGQYIKEGKIEKDENDFKKDDFCPICHCRYPDPARKICPKCMDRGKLLRRMGIFLKKYRKEIALILLFLVLVSAIGVIAPYFSSKFFYDQVLNKDGSFYGQILFVIMLIASMNVCSILINMFASIITSKVAGKLVYDMKRTIFDSIKRLSLSFFTGRQTGSLMTQINNDATSIYWFFVDGLPYFLINIIQVIAVFIVMLTMNLYLSLLCAGIIPLFLFIISRLFRRMEHLHAKNYSCCRAFNSTLTDAFSGMRVIKAFAREKEEGKRFHARAAKVTDMYKEITVFNNTAFPFANAIMYLSTIVVWIAGGWMTMNGEMTYGTLLTFLSYVGILNAPMFMFVDMTYFFSQFINAVQRLFEIHDAIPDVIEAAAPVRIESIEGKVEFRHVEFSYDKSRKIIDDVSFTIEPGKMIGIVGHSGAGKSTLANLLIRLYDVSAGEIYIDDINIKQYAFKDLRRNIAIVSQETYLFIGSILDNIRYAKPDATKDEIIEAAKIAGAHPFIIKLPDAYDTQIGIGNKELSGGERQRISIARAVLLNPKILILDEATAAMDTETERAIQDALERLIAGKTTIMIAHRLSTLRDADKLIVIENGKMPEFGTHTELLKQKGIYHKLYTLQMDALKNIGVSE